jgi:DNA-binding MarR family transcriptional regulator
MALKAVTPGKSPEPTLGTLLSDAVRLLRRDFYQRTQGMKLTPALARLLYFVNRESGCSQVDLAARLEITPVTLGRMVDRLVNCGYVRRVPDAQDRRVFRVFVDRAGEPLVVRMAELSSQTAARAMRGLSKREQAELASHLAKICQNLASGDRSDKVA